MMNIIPEMTGFQKGMNVSGGLLGALGWLTVIVSIVLQPSIGQKPNWLMLIGITVFFCSEILEMWVMSPWLSTGKQASRVNRSFPVVWFGCGVIRVVFFVLIVKMLATADIDTRLVLLIISAGLIGFGLWTLLRYLHNIGNRKKLHAP
jgi:hypothetical protein